MTVDRTGLTPKQALIYDFIVTYYQREGIFPSVREIGKGVGLSSTGTIQTHINKLIEKGFLGRDNGKSRVFSLLREENPASSDTAYDRGEIIDLPLIGRVAAGTPILAEENREETLPLPASLIKSGSKESFLLRVHGDSMIDAGVLDGDMVIVRAQRTALPGAMVVALIDDEATVKYYYPETDHIRLQPANDAFEPILSREAEVVGEVIGVLRIFR
ncbi:MAG: transcriptional repressor LexA [Actinomycetia bacterium]|nr:transcriptional repressor LexA [Actinomycetes bacterium]